MNSNPNSDFSRGTKHQMTGNRWHTWRQQQQVLWSTWELFHTIRYGSSRRKCHRAGKPGSCSTKKKVSWASHFRPTYCSSSSIIYNKRLLEDPALPLFVFVDHTAHRQMAWMLRRRVRPVLWRLTSALICSLTRECVCIVSFPRPVLLFLSPLLGECGYIDYTFFIDFTSWASNVCFSVNGCREERGTQGGFECLWIWIIIIYNLLPLSDTLVSYLPLQTTQTGCDHCVTGKLEILADTNGRVRSVILPSNFTVFHMFKRTNLPSDWTTNFR